MNKLNRILLVILLFELALFFANSSSALYSDTASSVNNTFTASLEFPTGSLTPSP